MDSEDLVTLAERAVATGDLRRAVMLLSEEAASRSNDAELWMKVAALHRATGNPRAALDSVHRALAVSPLDFTMLLMKASLMQRLGYPDAGQAWGHALAQRPEGELPPQLKDAIVEGERQHAAWVGAREARLRAATGAAEASAAPAERKRIERFRSNILGRTKAFHSSPTHFHFPELAEREFHPRDLFPWIEELEAGTERIASEMHSVMNAERAALVPYIQYDDHLPLDQWRSLNRSPDWTAIHLFRNGVEVADNAQFCPQTLELLSRVPQPRIEGAGPNAMFSLLAPRTRIPSHVGISNARLVCHLPLVVPEGCWFRVGAEVRQWKHGEAFVFDDTIEHEAMNPTDELRVVFIFDLWHPDLTEVEREAVTALLGAEGAPTGL